MQSNVSLEGLSDFTILTVAGLNGSGPDHWQSRWDFRLANCRRVQMGDWHNPIRSYWVERLDQGLRAATRPVLLAAHSLGCLTVVRWAAQHWSIVFQDVVAGAMLVAPPDVERADAPQSIRSFGPAPREPLPFPSLLVASRNDPFVSFETSARMAQMWNSDFVDLGNAGHINADSGLREWTEGLQLLASVGQRALAEQGPKLWPLDRRTRSIRPRGLAMTDPV
jgi:hypothetical protein